MMRPLVVLGVLLLVACSSKSPASTVDMTGPPSDLATGEDLAATNDLAATADLVTASNDLIVSDALAPDLVTTDLVNPSDDLAGNDPCGTPTTGTGFAVTNATAELNHLQSFETPTLGVVLVNPMSATSINVFLGVPLDTNSAETLGHWSISPSLGITQIVANGTFVTLTTDPQTPGQAYTLTINGVSDVPKTATLTGTTAPFTGYQFHATTLAQLAYVPAGQIIVLFSDTVACTDAMDAANYTLDGNAIMGVQNIGCSTRVSMVTLLLAHGLSAGPHTLALASALVDKFGHSLTPLALTITGPSQAAPLFVASAQANSASVVELSFNDTLDPTSAANPTHYAITPTAAVSSATVNGGSHVLLGGVATTANDVYAIDVANVLANGGSVATNVPTAYTWGWQSFYPTSVFELTPHQLRIYFSDSVHNSVSAGNPSNYVFSGGVTATAVTADNLQALVTLTGDLPGQTYSVDLSALTSAAGVPMSQGFAGVIHVVLNSSADTSVVPTVLAGGADLTLDGHVGFLDDKHLTVETGLLPSGLHSVRVCGLDNAGHTSHIGKVDVQFSVP